jgi:hypothetical protein
MEDQLVKNKDSIVIAFMRAQPPTRGHALTIYSVMTEAKARRSDSLIFVSQSEDKQKNPLPIDYKMDLLNRWFLGIRFLQAESPMHALLRLSRVGYKEVAMVTGRDRLEKFSTWFPQYVNHPDTAKNLAFNTLDFICAGERDPDSDDLQGISATRARLAAREGRYEDFVHCMPVSEQVAHDDIMHLFRILQYRYSQISHAPK